MSIQEEADRLRNIALPFGEIQHAMQVLADAQAQVQTILGDTQRNREVQGALESAKASLDNSYGVVQEAERQITEAANHHANG
ncbi:hypothetical protein ACFORO_12385 [Amycolatopsis halotolerans]|uniref:Uncharacterized protein n=1 Tax=Amycolatopsis halotolerans TaxID=330083 RepID=A0ABV7QFB3_9PSEU